MSETHDLARGLLELRDDGFRPDEGMAYRLAELVLADEPRAVRDAREIARLLHDEGKSPTDAVTAVGLNPDDVYSEDDSAFALDDDDNDLIDLSWHNGLWVGVRRIDGVWTVETLRRET